MGMLARGEAAFSIAIRFASAPIIRCCAAVGGSAALRMRHTPCGCRSAHLVAVRSNHRLPPVPTMRRAPAMPLFRKQSAAEVTSLAPHDSKARLQDVTKRRDSWRSHVHRTYIAQRVQLFELQSGNVGGRGVLPSPFSGGSKGGILFGKRIPLLVGSSVTRCITTPRNARIIMLLCGRKKRQLFCSARCRWRTLSHSAYPGARCG